MDVMRLEEKSHNTKSNTIASQVKCIELTPLQLLAAETLNRKPVRTSLKINFNVSTDFTFFGRVPT